MRKVFQCAGLLLVLTFLYSFQVMAQDAYPQPSPTPWQNPLQKSKATSGEEGTALSRPNALSIELLGRGLLYSFDYDRSISDNFAVGAGIAGYSVSSGSASLSLLIIPVYGNYYFSPGPSRGFLTAGLDIVSASGSDSSNTISASGAVPTLGGGFEYRGEGGFLFRFPVYVVFGQGSTQFWFGIGLGFTF